jgi:histidinol-phosphate aminotransferase
MYGDSENHVLRAALAEHHGIGPENIIVGEGIDGLLGYLVRMLVSAGDAVVTSDGAYPTFNYHVSGFGGVLHKVPYRDDHQDPASLLDRAEQVGAKLVYFCNPDNPMGSWWDSESIVAFARALPAPTLLILDEAYSETAPEGSIPAADALVDLPNVIRTRTFSKAYGLAGARVGYGIGTPGTVSAFDKIRNHFGMPRLSTEAALAALADQAYLDDVVKRIKAARERIASIATANGLGPLPSATNFVAIDCGRDGVFARAIVDGLMEHGVFIRMPGVAPLNRCIRVSAGMPEDLDLFEEALPKVLKALG